ncbi:MAG: RNA polymerase sigma-70 factor [Rhodothermales bacterium]|nr:RNA polymerase sigma-70 factor [Rhodothermales bacterium]MBO6781564.1 RNA polymerase sigma-70 factor [Rhodothermales bacterium]
MSDVSEGQFRIWSIAIRSSDREAFAALFENMHDPLYRYADYIVRDREAAADLVQEAFAKIWQVRDSLDPERSLKALLFQMVRNASLNHERHKKRRRTEALDAGSELSSDEHSVEDYIDADTLGSKINSWINAMPERRKEAFLLSRREGLSHEEISKLMGLAPKTVNNHIVLALQHIRKKLDAYREAGVEVR